MFQKILEEISIHCRECPRNSVCMKNECVVYRIKKHLPSAYGTSKVNIDDFFEPEDKVQFSVFDLLGGDGS